MGTMAPFCSDCSVYVLLIDSCSFDGKSESQNQPLPGIAGTTSPSASHNCSLPKLASVSEAA